MDIKTIHPYYNQEKVFYIRKENNNHYSIVSKTNLGGDKVKIINQTSMYIMEQCDGKRSINEIVSELHNKFPEVDKEIIQNDVLGTIFFLKETGFVEINKAEVNEIEPPVFKEGYKLSKLEQKDSKRISEFILNTFNEESKDFYVNSINESFLYNPLVLDQRLANETEELFLIEKDSEILGVIGVSNEASYFSKSEISLIIIKNNDIEILSTLLLDYTLNDIKDFADKIKINIVAPNENQEIITNYLTKNNFKIEGELKNEPKLNCNTQIFSKYRIQ